VIDFRQQEGSSSELNHLSLCNYEQSDPLSTFRFDYADLPVQVQRFPALVEGMYSAEFPELEEWCKMRQFRYLQ